MLKEKIFMSDKNNERKLTVQDELTDFLLIPLPVGL